MKSRFHGGCAHASRGRWAPIRPIPPLAASKARRQDSTRKVNFFCFSSKADAAADRWRLRALLRLALPGYGLERLHAIVDSGEIYRALRRPEPVNPTITERLN